MTTTTTTNTLAVGGATPKDGETLTLLQAAVTAMVPPNVLSASPPAHRWPISFARGGMQLGSCRLAAMLTLTTRTMTVQVMAGGSE